jgi:hypothetical protein
LSHLSINLRGSHRTSPYSFSPVKVTVMPGNSHRFLYMMAQVNVHTDEC